MLTEKGLDRAEVLAPQIEDVDLSRVARTAEEKRIDKWLKRERGRMLESDIFKRFSLERRNTISVREAEGFFKLDEYIKGESRKRKVDRLVEAFGNDPDLGSAVRELASKVLEES